MSALKMPGTTNPGEELLAGALQQLDSAAKALGLGPGREAAVIVAVERVAKAIEQRGIFP